MNCTPEATAGRMPCGKLASEVCEAAGPGRISFVEKGQVTIRGVWLLGCAMLSDIDLTLVSCGDVGFYSSAPMARLNDFTQCHIKH